MKNFYDILGVRLTASSDEIKKAYKRCARKYHPDNPDNEGDVDKFNEAVKAYETLIDSEKRENYDKAGYVDESDIDDIDYNIQQLFNKVINDNGFDGNLVERVVSEVDVSIDVLTTKLGYNKHEVKTLEKQLTRVSVEKGANMFKLALLHRINNLNANYNQLQSNLNGMKEVSERLRLYHDCDEFLSLAKHTWSSV